MIVVKPSETTGRPSTWKRSLASNFFSSEEESGQNVEQQEQ